MAGLDRPLADRGRRDRLVRQRGNTDGKRTRSAACARNRVGAAVHLTSPAAVILAEIHDIFGISASSEYNIGQIFVCGVVRGTDRRGVIAVCNRVRNQCRPVALLFIKGQLVHQLVRCHVVNHQNVPDEFAVRVLRFQFVLHFVFHRLHDFVLIEQSNVLFM